MNKLIITTLGLAAAASTQAFAAIAYVDLGDRDNDLTDGGLFGGVHWTTIDSNGTTMDLRDSVDNTDTGWNLGITGIEGDSPNSAGLVGHILEPGVTDGLWNRPANAFTMTISGLDGSGATTYDLSLFGNRSNSDDAGINYTVQGSGAAINSGDRAQGNATGVTSPWDVTGVTPTAGGIITIDMATPTGVDLSIVSTMSITAVPEPSSAALLGLGGLALILRRKK